MLLLLAAGLAAGGGASAQPPSPCAGPRVLAFTGVTVLPVDGERAIADQTVVVRDARIETVGATEHTAVPADAIRVDGRGRTLMPGLAEMHAHVPGQNEPAYADLLALYPLTGVTTVRAMLGTPFQLELRRRIEAGELLGPTLFTVAPPFNPSSVSGPEEARARVREYHAAGYDQLKIFGVPSVEAYDAIAETAREVGIRFAGHVAPNVGILHSIAMGQSVEHLDGYVQLLRGDPTRLEELVRATVAAGVWNTPTLDVWKTLLGARDPGELDRRPELAYVPRAMRDGWRRSALASRPGVLRRALGELGLLRSAAAEIALRDRLLAALHRAGAPLLVGADSPQVYSVPGFSIARELRAMEAAGLPRSAVLEAATRAPAAYFGRSGEVGRVAAGLRADLVLLEGNPLDDLRHVERPAGVVLRGCWLPRAELDRQLQAIAERAGGGGPTAPAPGA